MRVPVVIAVGTARIELHEAHAILDHAARHQALGAEVARALARLDPIEALGGFGLTGKIHQSRRRGLHAIGQLE